MDAHDPVTNASFIALALGLVKVIEVLVGLIAKKVRGSDEHSQSNGVQKPEKITVELSPEATEMLRETHQAALDIERVIGRTDAEGTPMIYGPRHEVRDLSRRVEDLAEDTKQISAAVSSLKG